MQRAFITLTICLLATAWSFAQAQQGEVVDGPANTGPAQTGPAQTGPANRAKKTPTKRGQPRPKRVPGVTPEREAAAITFVQQHHPELARLLVTLKKHRVRDYQRAVVDLFHASERLAQMQDVDEETYQLELKLWKARSRVELLGARLRMKDTEKCREELEDALDEQLTLQKMKLLRERDRLAARMQRLDDQIERLENGRDQYVERQVRVLTRKARQAGKKPDKSNKSASKSRLAAPTKPPTEKPTSQGTGSPAEKDGTRKKTSGR